MNDESRTSWWSRWAPVVALGFGIAMLVSSEFLPASVLPTMAADLGVSPGTAGLAVAATAVAGAVTAPSIAVVLPRLDRRLVLVGLLVAGAVANAAVALAPSFALMLVGRLLLGVAISGYWAFAFGTGARVVPGRASVVAAAIATGVSLATVVAVPLASLVGDRVDWRVTFGGGAVATAVAAVLLAIALPAVPADAGAGWAMLRQALVRPRLMLGVGCIVLTAFGNFAAYPYIRLVIARVEPGWTTALLLLWGLGGLAGNLLVGAVGVRLRLLAATAPILLGCSLLAAQVGRSPLVLVVAIMLWGFSFNMLPATTQLWVSRAEPERAEAATSLQVTAFQVAITAGSALGGVLLDAHGVGAVLLLAGSAAVLSGLGFAAIPVRRAEVGAPGAGRDPVLQGEGSAEGGRRPVADREGDLCDRA